MLILYKDSDLKHCAGVFSVSYRLKGAEIYIPASSTQSDSAKRWLRPTGELANTSVQTQVKSNAVKSTTRDVFGIS